MLALNRSLLNEQYILINIPKAFVSIISVCGLHAILLSKITSRYFYTGSSTYDQLPF
jgi:hypothetical protein